MTEEKEPPGYILVGDLCYPIEEWIWHLNLAVLEHLELHIPEGASVRKILRVIRDSKSAANLKRAIAKTVQILEASEVEGILPEVVTRIGGVICGVIPLLDKPDAPR